MILKQNKKTVFVLGAGASVPYSFPDGRKLRNNIINQFKKEIKKLIERKKERFNIKWLKTFNNRVDNFILHFDKSRTNIDLFLTRRKGDYDELGIIAIFNEILKAERNCNFRTVKAEVDWLYWFFNIYLEGIIKIEDIEQLYNWNYSFITFNYDRILEKYLQSAITANFGKTIKEKDIINKVMNNIKIHHIYGSLGSLNWQNSNLPIVDFGSSYNYDEQLSLSKNIQIMHDKRSNQTINDIREELKNADRVFFLGFAFAQENIRQLDIPAIFRNREVHIYATAFGSSENEIRRIATILIPNKSWHIQPKVRNLDCLGLLKEYLFDY